MESQPLLLHNGIRNRIQEPVIQDLSIFSIPPVLRLRMFFLPRCEALGAVSITVSGAGLVLGLKWILNLKRSGSHLPA